MKRGGEPRPGEREVRGDRTHEDERAGGERVVQPGGVVSSGLQSGPLHRTEGDPVAEPDEAQREE